MKRNLLKLIPLLCIGCLTFSACGSKQPGDLENEDKNVQAEEVAPQTIDGVTDGEEASLSQKISDSTSEISDIANKIASHQSDVSNTGSSNPSNASGTTDPSSTSGAGILDQAALGVRQSVTGIITDASKSYISFQTQDGASHYLTIPEEGLEGGLRYLTIGQFATINYIGSLDEKHARLTSVTESSMTTDIYLEEYAFAIRIMDAVKNMDMEALSDLSNFPLFIDTGNYAGPMNTSGEFEAIDSEKIFTAELVEKISNFNLFELKYTDAGFVMGTDGPSITFDVDYDGILGVIGITCISDANRPNTK